MEEKHRYWLAAFVDGEGSVIIRSRNRASGRMTVNLVLANNHIPLLEFAQSICEAGKVYGGNRAHQLRIERTDDVLRILRQIAPILIMKREKAEAAIVLLETQGKWTPERANGRFVGAQ